MVMTRCETAVLAPAPLPRTERSHSPAKPTGQVRQPRTVMDRPAQLPVPVSEEWNWQLAATCRGMEVELFFHPARERRGQKQRRIDQAKAICNDCPVLEECRRYALQTREPYGIWGGLSEEERAAILGVGNLRYPAPAGRKHITPGAIPAPASSFLDRSTTASTA